ncbi:catalase-like [Chrysoperla carnea]|uniref:catalase-like n=1 Tax=Chrysoperla carnea TaxID=189513 RepID=UPI001D064A2E|nr:catalase-like [Chrysoperla carnea]
MSKGDAAANQLIDFKNKQKNPTTTLRSWGSPTVYKDATLSVGPDGLLLLQDNDYFDEMTHFARERIPERVVHAKGAGAFGFFEVTNDITQYTAAKVFSKIGKRTPVAVRFSQVADEAGSADTIRDVRGFAIKYYTEDGVWDFVGCNTPVFFIRDPILFPSLNHATKRNPVSHVKDANAFWDFMSLRPETAHQLMYVFGDRGIPASYRNMNGHGAHAFKFVNSDGNPIYCKFHYKTDLGVKNLDPNAAQQIAGSDPDFLLRDLYNAIADGNYPSWTMYIQVMPFADVPYLSFNPFDATKVWPQSDYPYIEVGKLILNQNPSSYFNEVEQIAFAPSNFVPGIEPSPDTLLQGRLFIYGDTQRYRLGSNFNQLPVNAPFREQTPTNYLRDGANSIKNQGGAPNYHPNSFKGPEVDSRALKLQPKVNVSGDVYRYDSGNEDNYSQAGILYRNVFDDGARKRFVNNVANHCSKAAIFIQDRVVLMFSNVDSDLGSQLQSELIKRRNNVSSSLIK